MAVVGSAEMFADAWLACEGNTALLAWLLAWAHPVLPSPPIRVRDVGSACLQGYTGLVG